MLPMSPVMALAKAFSEGLINIWAVCVFSRTEVRPVRFASACGVYTAVTFSVNRLDPNFGVKILVSILVLSLCAALLCRISVVLSVHSALLAQIAVLFSELLNVLLLAWMSAGEDGTRWFHAIPSTVILFAIIGAAKAGTGEYEVIDYGEGGFPPQGQVPPAGRRRRRMRSFEKYKQERIQNVVSIIKLFLVFILLIALFQNYFSIRKLMTYSAGSLYRAFVLLVIFACLVFWWTSIPRSFRPRPFAVSVVEYAVFLCAAAFAVISTENYEYRYSFVFMILVTAATVEKGMRFGAAVSAAAGAFNISYALMRGRLFPESELPVIFAYFIACYTVGYYVNGEKEHVAHLTRQVSHDPLTGLENHTGFHGLFDRYADGDGKVSSLALIFADFDDFNIYNRIAGHEGGDQALITAAEYLGALQDSQVRVYRYSEDEFAVLVIDRSEEFTLELARRAASDLSRMEFAGQEALPTGNLSVTLGAAFYPAGVREISDMVQAAQDALSKAKFRNRASLSVYTDLMRSIAQDVFSDDEKDAWVSMRALLAVVNSRDNYTSKHTERVAGYCAEFAAAMGMPARESRDLVEAAFLHDIGKLNVSGEVLLKTASLTREETELLRTHPAKGAQLAGDIPALAHLAGIVRHHHERYDGTGYPDGLAGDDIEPLARILTVADAFDAMTSPRPYQKKKTFRQGCQTLIENAGTQFDPRIVELFTGMMLKGDIEKKEGEPSAFVGQE